MRPVITRDRRAPATRFSTELSFGTTPIRRDAAMHVSEADIASRLAIILTPYSRQLQFHASHFAGGYVLVLCAFRAYDHFSIIYACRLRLVEIRASLTIFSPRDDFA